MSIVPRPIGLSGHFAVGADVMDVSFTSACIIACFGKRDETGARSVPLPSNVPPGYVPRSIAVHDRATELSSTFQLVWSSVRAEAPRFKDAMDCRTAIINGEYSFREALPDEGDMDFFRVLKALKDVDYCYGIDPDHVPRTEDDPKGYYQSYAYCFGYINAMIQAVYG